ncbi:hypothetical protein SteCoe_9863 [Stentor coeruleus]|uniref:Uncharacterized protein n=1 Tax=Stentor coeruleus TaxID=5963 RepID=A0A1R2CH23_9CILI|nr:hypothetical protein SteCoe_9863 [Stentor coeruleus]
MSGYYPKNYNRYSQKTRYRPRYYQKPNYKEPEKNPEVISEAVQAEIPKTQDKGIQITMGEGIPCRLIPLNPDDYPRLLALLNMHQNPS